jgi:hypothetical protein
VRVRFILEFVLLLLGCFVECSESLAIQSLLEQALINYSKVVAGSEVTGKETQNTIKLNTFSKFYKLPRYGKKNLNIFVIIWRKTTEGESGFLRDLESSATIPGTPFLMQDKVKRPWINFYRRNLSRMGLIMSIHLELRFPWLWQKNLKIPSLKFSMR